MIFKEIKLVNFRQYKGEHNFVFSQPEKGTISLLIANNGVGKTTFIQAFRYCFYGDRYNNQYLNLPNPEDLINNTIIEDIEAGKTEDVRVEVKFEHEGKDYIMARNFKYMKSANKMVLLEKSSTLSQGSLYSGYTSFENEEADEEMSKILPAGLSHIFMFDGERMEQQVSSKEFSEELKESILGILNLKKYDVLVNDLGATNRKTSVIGRIHSQISHSSIEEREKTLHYNNLKDSLEAEEETRKDIVKRLDKNAQEKAALRRIQETYTDNKDKRLEMSQNELEIANLENKKNEILNTLMNLSLRLLKYSLLLEAKPNFDDFISEIVNHNDFYQYLHINTLEEILEKRKCICGTAIQPHSLEEEMLIALKKTALPEARSQNISFIQSDIFAQMKGYSEEYNIFKKKKTTLNEINAELQTLFARNKRISEELTRSESEKGYNAQERINALDKEKEKLIENRTNSENRIEQYNLLINQRENELRPMWEKSSNNAKLSKVVKELEHMKNKLKLEKEEKESKARKLLSTYLNEEIALVMSGSYEAKINKDYEIIIVDKDIDKDVSEVLSTGQNVIVSISFIKALIKTAKDLSEEYDENSNYGVVMDAALSNVDEDHIKKISESNLKQMDQLIFLSFKRQLRNEMYSSIKDNIGIAYALEIENGKLISEQIEMNQLENYIHEGGLEDEQ